ncbi:hypothetical protein PTKIN_Ptkin16aG0041200 [Pterospermum kingtungense]
MDAKTLSMVLITHLLLLSPLKCHEEIRDGGTKSSFASVPETVAGDSISKSGRAFCSLRTEPDHFVVFQYLHTNSTLLQVQLSDCSEVRIGSYRDRRDNKKMHRLDSAPIISDGPQIQLFFYDWHGNITPINDHDLSFTINNWIPNASIFCTLTSYEATLSTAKKGKFTRKTRTTVHCGLSNEVIPETIPLSSYMVQHIYKVIEEVAKLVSFYQWGYSSFNHRISGLDIVALNLTSRTWQNVTTEEYQMTASLSFSTSLQPFRVCTVAVLVRSFGQFVNINHDDNHNKPQLKGFSTDVFKAAADVLPYHFSYKLVPFYGSADQLVEEVSIKTFDAAAGDIVVTAKRSHLVGYSQPYAELGLVMVVKKKGIDFNNVLWFMSPFTLEMWPSMVGMTVFTGFVVWLIEHRTRNNESAEPPACRQVEAVFCFPFAFLFNEHRPKNRLTYFLLIPWLMLTLIVTTTFTASLGSIVTSSQVLPSGLDVDSLKRTNAVIACDGNPFTVSYLEKSLGFKPDNIIRNISSIDDFSELLSRENIKAAFMLTPDANVFLAKHCSEGFTKTGPAFNIGSFAFVFPRGSPLASDMSEAILELKEAGKLKQMEEDMYSYSDCSSSKSDETVSRGIGPGAFSGLFILSGGASASALLITVIGIFIKRWKGYVRRMLMVRGLIWLRLPILFFHQNQTRNQLQLSRLN